MHTEERLSTGSALNQIVLAMVVPYQFVPPEYGGQRAAFAVCEELSHHLSFICISSINNAGQKIPFVLWPLIPSNILKYVNPVLAFRILKSMKSSGVNHCILFQPFIMPLLVIPMKLAGIKIHIYIQNIEYQRFRSMRKWWWSLIYIVEYLSYHWADYLYFISPDDLSKAKIGFRLQSNSCSVLQYSTKAGNPLTDKERIRSMIRKRHGFRDRDHLIFFFGLLSYQPNAEAVERIVKMSNHETLSQNAGSYRFILCGKGLSATLKDMVASCLNVVYLGHVENIHEYISAMDLVINPVVNGGGMKTKIIEAIALGKTVISTRFGAKGINKEVCASKLKIVSDESIEGFCKELIKHTGREDPTPEQFYAYYNASNAVQVVLDNCSS